VAIARRLFERHGVVLATRVDDASRAALAAQSDSLSHASSRVSRITK
jgi:hypothetical protein